MPISNNPDDELRLTLIEIDKNANAELVKKIGNFLSSLPPTRNVEVATALSILLADCLVDMCDTQPEVCAISYSYGAYIHEYAHASFKHEEEEEEEKTREINKKKLS